jgi:hypothetical protein
LNFMSKAPAWHGRWVADVPNAINRLYRHRSRMRLGNPPILSSKTRANLDVTRWLAHKPPRKDGPVSGAVLLERSAEGFFRTKPKGKIRQ